MQHYRRKDEMQRATRTRMLATLATFHLARFWLKADADANDMCMCNTEATFQPPISALKLEAL